MKTRTIASVFCALLSLTTSPALQAAETNPPALVIYTVASIPVVVRSNYVGRQVIAVLWSDGKIVWSESRTNAGLLYKEGKFPPEKLAALLNTLERKGAFSDEALKRAWFGPDSSFTAIAINDGQRHLTMRSWHEGIEQSTNLVATASGIESLNGQKREDVLRAQPEDYRRFRETWSEIRQAVAAIIPEKGELYQGQITIPTGR